MSRDERIWLEDIVTACGRIRDYVGDHDQEAFERDTKTFDAVMRNLAIMGEATKALPNDFRVRHPQVEWRKISGLRDVVIHQYFGVDLDVVWDVIRNKVPELEREIRALLAE